MNTCHRALLPLSLLLALCACREDEAARGTDARDAATTRPAATSQPTSQPAKSADPVQDPAAGKSPRSAMGFDLTPVPRETAEVLAAPLDDLARRVTLEEATERSFSGDLWDHKGDGTYGCAVCGLPLFDSKTKFRSGTGWPSYWEPVDPAHVRTVTDHHLGYARSEVECARCGSHQGHVFERGYDEDTKQPTPTGLRYCINSASLRFIPRDEPLPGKDGPVGPSR